MIITSLTELMSEAPMVMSLGLGLSAFFSWLTYKGLSADNPMEIPARLYGSSCLLQLVIAGAFAAVAGFSGNSMVSAVIYMSAAPFVMFYLFLGRTKAGHLKENLEEKRERMKRMHEMER